MNLYFISQQKNSGYDTYDSAVVSAQTEKEARETWPGYSTTKFWSESKKTWADTESDHTYDNPYEWTTPEHVEVYFIGTAKEGTEPGVICASFNAG